MLDIEKVQARTVAEDRGYTTPCEVWTLEPQRNGYARVYLGGGRGYAYAHRVAYEHFIGPIPDGLVIDHLCRVPLCCNPEHMEPVTRMENWRRGEAPNAVAIRTGRCARGHVNGGGRCMECKRVANARHDRKRRAAGRRN